MSDCIPSPPAPPADMIPTIAQSAAAPRRAQGDSGSMEQHSLPDQIAFDRYQKSAAALKSGLGIKPVKLIPPGATDVDFCP